MTGAQLRAILLLPFNALVVVPTAILVFGRGPDLAGFGEPRGWAALACLGVGVTLMASTIRLFHAIGQGSLAPWAPTRKLVVRGVYRHVRNPMISGVLFNLLGEALLFGSPGIAAWFALFALANAVYIPLSEEPGLEARFGDDYRRYKRHVPRWLPRLRPWQPPHS